jgi:predicted nucleotidyltransferase
VIRPTPDGDWRKAPSLSLEWRLERVWTFLRRLPLDRARGIVFGSVARRAFSIGSDTDLLVISDDLPADVRARIDLLGDLRDGLGEIDPIGWTEEEWSRRLAAGDPFAALVEREGISVPSRD